MKIINNPPSKFSDSVIVGQIIVISNVKFKISFEERNFDNKIKTFKVYVWSDTTGWILFATPEDFGDRVYNDIHELLEVVNTLIMDFF